MPKRRSRKSTPQNLAKKQKALTDESPIGSSYLELLPKELLEKIYSNLRPADILILMLTSKTIKTFIEENLSRIFTVCFSKAFRRKPWIGSRVYENVIFSYDLPINFIQHFIKILSTFGSGVKNLTINCKVTKEDLVEILKICKNIEYYKFASATYHVMDEFELDYQIERDLAVAKALSETFPPLELSNLKSIYSYDFGKTFGVFSNCQVTKFCQRHLSNYINEPILRDTRVKNFLMKQEKLESLALWHCRQDCALFESSEISMAKFKLKSLQLCYFYLQNEQIKNFELFLEVHKETLTHLEVFEFSYGISKIFNICENLKVLNINNVDFGALNEVCLESVESLTCDQNDLKKVDEIFPNLRELNLKRFKFSDEEPSFYNLNFLEKLTLEFCDKIPQLKIPTVKFLKFFKCDFSENLNPVDWSENKLEELIVENCVEAKFIYEENFYKNVNLNLLKLMNLELEEKAKEIIENERENFKILILTEDVKYLDDKKFLQMTKTRRNTLKRLWGAHMIHGRPKKYFM